MGCRDNREAVDLTTCIGGAGTAAAVNIAVREESKERKEEWWTEVA